MNDDRFERQLRDAVRRMAGGPASPMLRAHVASIPGEHRRRARGISQLSVGLRLAGAAGAFLVTVVVAALVLATLPRPSAIVPGAMGSPSATSSEAPSSMPTAGASASPATPAPTGLTSPVPAASGPVLWPASALPGTVSLTLAQGTLRTLILPAASKPGRPTEPFASQAGGPSTGPFVYLGPTTLPDDTWTRASRLYVADLGGGSVRQVPVPLQGREAIASATATSGILVVLVWQHTGAQPAAAGPTCWSDISQPLEWRLLVASLGSDGFPVGSWRELDVGVATRRFRDPLQMAAGCDEARLPNVALAGGRVAYDVDDPTAQSPAGSSIRIRSVATGELERSINTETQVTRLALSSAAVAWVESPNTYAPGGDAHWRVMRAPIATGSADSVPLGPIGQGWHFAPTYLVLDGDAVLISDGYAGTAEGTTLRSQGTSVQVLNPSGSPNCEPLAAASGVVILRCGVEGASDAVTVWGPASALRALAGAPSPIMHSEQLGDAWFSWLTYDTTGTKIGVSAVPVAALVPAQ